LPLPCAIVAGFRPAGVCLAWITLGAVVVTVVVRTPIRLVVVVLATWIIRAPWAIRTTRIVLPSDPVITRITAWPVIVSTSASRTVLLKESLGRRWRRVIALPRRHINWPFLIINAVVIWPYALIAGLRIHIGLVIVRAAITTGKCQGQ
jgi:hypothetical protein